MPYEKRLRTNYVGEAKRLKAIDGAEGWPSFSMVPSRGPGISIRKPLDCVKTGKRSSRALFPLRTVQDVGHRGQEAVRSIDNV